MGFWRYIVCTDGKRLDHLTAICCNRRCLLRRIMGGTKDDLYTITTPAYTDTDMMVEYAKLMKEWDNIGVEDVLNNTASSNRDDYRMVVLQQSSTTQTWTDFAVQLRQIRFIRMIQMQSQFLLLRRRDRKRGSTFHHTRCNGSFPQQARTRKSTDGMIY